MKYILNMIIFFSFLTLALISQALDNAKCSRMLNNGLYKTYRWQGINNRWPDLTNETKRNGSSNAYSEFTSENSTALLDPKYSSNLSSSLTNGTSSFGDCSLIALKERTHQRDLYIAQNFDQIRKNIAEGRGKHLEILSYMSLCEENAQSDFNTELQSGYEEIYTSKESTPSQSIDKIISKSKNLHKKCFNLSSI